MHQGWYQSRVTVILSSGWNPLSYHRRPGVTIVSCTFNYCPGYVCTAVICPPWCRVCCMIVLAGFYFPTECDVTKVSFTRQINITDFKCG